MGRCSILMVAGFAEANAILRCYNHSKYLLGQKNKTYLKVVSVKYFITSKDISTEAAREFRAAMNTRMKIVMIAVIVFLEYN